MGTDECSRRKFSCLLWEKKWKGGRSVVNRDSHAGHLSYMALSRYR